MDSFLVIYHLPKLNQDQINILNTAVASSEIKAVINVYK